MHSYSVKLICNSQRIKKDGSSALYLQVIINRIKLYIHLGMSWPAKFVDTERGMIRPRNKKDPDFSDYKMIVLSEMGKVNEIFKIYRIQDKLLTKELFKKEFKGFSLRTSFIDFMSHKIDERERNKSISPGSAKNHRSNLNKLIEYKEKVLFHEIDSRFLENFAGFMRTDDRYRNEVGTIWNTIKDIKAYISIARKEGIGVNEDYLNFSNTSPKGRIIYLESEEIDALMKIHNSKILDGAEAVTLRAFLFSCFTSLRISDVREANWSWVNIRNEIQFYPFKNRHLKKHVTILLSSIAISLIERRTGKFFNLPTDQEMNRSLKEIMGRAGIRKPVTFHTARHTFATHFYRETKDVISLQQIMGHSRTETTMVYVHISEEDKRVGIKSMEKAFMKSLPINRLVS